MNTNMAGGEMLVGCSPADAGIITVWDLSTGLELTHFHGCASPRNALATIGYSYIAASQIHKPSPHSASSAGPICFWRWGNSQIHLKTFPMEQIGPLACTNDGVYLMGGGVSGEIHVWELPTGKVVRSWNAHKKAVSVLTLIDDESLLISGGDDGHVNAWPLIRILDIAEGSNREMQVLSLYSWAAHTLPVTGIACGIGGCNSIIISCSLDCTLKIWSLALGTHFRTLRLPTSIISVVVDPSERAFYAGGTDGRIYIGALQLFSRRNNGMNVDGIIGSLFDHSGPVTALSFSMDGVSLISASEDCTIRLWDTRSDHVLRIFNHSRGPISSILVLPPQPLLQTSNSSYDGLMGKQLFKDSDGNFSDCNYSKATSALLLPKLEKVTRSMDSPCCSMGLIRRPIKELEAMKANLVVVNKDRQRALDMLDKMIQAYRKFLDLCMSEAVAGKEKKDKEEGQGKDDMVFLDKNTDEGQETYYKL
eukprot:Gb_20347 [translate_table: standard]